MKQLSESELHRIVEMVVQRKVRAPLEVESPLVADYSPGGFKQESVSIPGAERTVAVASDHGGFAMKEMLKSFLADQGYATIDCGTNNGKTSVDYPDFAFVAALLLNEGKVWRAIVVDGAGIGSCMAANKVPGVRAAMCYDYATAVNSREHNDANLLTLGAGLIGDNLAKQIVSTWLTTDFGGGRHQKRIDKICAIEDRFRKG